MFSLCFLAVLFLFSKSISPGFWQILKIHLSGSFLLAVHHIQNFYMWFWQKTLIQTWESQYFRQSSDQKERPEKTTNMLHQQIALFRRQNKLCGSGMAWGRTGFCLSLLNGGGPSVRAEAKRSSSQKLPIYSLQPPEEGAGRRGVTDEEALTAESAEQLGPTERPLWVRKCHISLQLPQPLLLLLLLLRLPPSIHPSFSHLCGAYVTTWADEWPYVRRCVQTAGDYTPAISSIRAPPHHHSGRGLLEAHSSLAPCKLDREEEYDNKQPYVHSTRNNIWAFFVLPHFPPTASLYPPVVRH